MACSGTTLLHLLAGGGMQITLMIANPTVNKISGRLEFMAFEI
jgi:hypothetical protein